MKDRFWELDLLQRGGSDRCAQRQFGDRNSQHSSRASKASSTVRWPNRQTASRTPRPGASVGDFIEIAQNSTLSISVIVRVVAWSITIALLQFLEIASSHGLLISAVVASQARKSLLNRRLSTFNALVEGEGGSETGYECHALALRTY